jgi:hypothetical protein
MLKDLHHNSVLKWNRISPSKQTYRQVMRIVAGIWSILEVGDSLHAHTQTAIYTLII